MEASASKKRILILGGGFGGVATARHLEGLCRRRPDVEEDTPPGAGAKRSDHS
jgi:glycine/D-amino acid oxidase-like deaminating enzyme